MNQTYTVKQVAEILGYSTNSIYTFLKEKRIKAVRVGKGRFRIPHTEVERLLSIKTAGTPVSPTQEVVTVESKKTFLPSIKTIPKLQYQNLFDLNNLFPKINLEIPSLFDWYIGISSILLGFGMFTFNKYLEEFSIEPYLVWLSPIKITFILGGAGLILSCLKTKSHRDWHSTYHTVLAFAYGFLAFIMWQIRDFDGAVIFLISTITLLISNVVKQKGILSFVVFAILFLIFVPISIIYHALFSQPLSLTPPNLLFMIDNPILTWSLWVAGSTALTIFILWSFFRHKLIFLFLLLLASLVLILISVWYAMNQLWSRSFILLLMALTNFFIPSWHTLSLSTQKQKNIIYISFGLVLTIFLAAIGIINLVQGNMISYTKEQLDNKVIYGALLVESSLQTMKQTLESAVTNRSFQEGLLKNDNEYLLGAAKNLFEGSRNFRRILILDDKGELMTIYPLGELTETNFSHRDYFQQAVKTKKTYVSDLFSTSSADQSLRLVMATPIIPNDNNTIGVLVGSVDLTYLGNRIQQIATFKKKEHFIVADKNKKIIIHPDQSQIGMSIEDRNVMSRAYDKEKNAIGYGSRGILVLQSFKGVENLDWKIAVSQPLTTIYGLTNPSIFIIYFTGIALMITIGTLIIYRHRQHIELQDTS